MPSPSVSAKDCIKIINIPWQGVRMEMFKQRLFTDVTKNDCQDLKISAMFPLTMTLAHVGNITQSLQHMGSKTPPGES